HRSRPPRAATATPVGRCGEDGRWLREVRPPSGTRKGCDPVAAGPASPGGGSLVLAGGGLLEADLDDLRDRLERDRPARREGQRASAGGHRQGPAAGGL